MRNRTSRLLSAVALVAAGSVLATGTAGAAGTTKADRDPAHRTAAEATALRAGAAADLTPEEQEQLRELAGAIWTPQLAANWNMNPAVADVLSQATDSILRCSEAFALVPRPPGFIPGVSYLLKYAKQLKEYFQAVSQNRTYRICVVNAAASYRTAIEMASLGI
ncbi:hypothetical protein V1L54_10670 [Streptomyces sp. TRM 70361]|uniref:hypothetical protein n=1 Tax=Streptomyces sp. TRM 70361 TaxID=3116553 RepID=UPI002E7BDD9C|nr:hypothetical protein [Streptomyces sp. TRM 70361]MEE1939863.1 hypothetical protein [Streptomyces sp. TRM 70361]